MSFNLDTFDPSGRDLEQHHLIVTGTKFTTFVQIDTRDPITDAVVLDRMLQFIHNLGDNTDVKVDRTSSRTEHLDNFDF